MRLKVINDAGSQKDSLRILAELCQRSIINEPIVRSTALQVVSGCASRDDRCELESIYNAIKFGSKNSDALRHGLKYVADPRWADYFVAPHNTLKMCLEGSNGGDCDDHSGLNAALAGALGFRVGFRAWGPSKDPSGEYVHVYAVAGYPKRDPKQVLAMDTTVDEAKLGWEPPYGHVMTAWLE